MSKKSVQMDTVAEERSKQLVDARLAASTSSGPANDNPPHSRAQLVGAVGNAPEAAARHQATAKCAAAAAAAAAATVLPRHIMIQGADGVCIPVLTHIAVRLSREYLTSHSQLLS